MPEAIIHPRTNEHLLKFIDNPSHALLLAGQSGIGKTHIAHIILAKVLGVSAADLERHPYKMIIAPQNNSISIDGIRQLNTFLQLKTLGDRPLRRAIIVEHAETMTTEAQNAYLKLLEEPPTDTIMILTTNNPRSLLATIMSRVQSIQIHAPSETALKAHFTEEGFDKTVIEQAFYLSGGMPGLMSALASSNKDHPLFTGVSLAKELLKKTPFERLAMVEMLAKKKDDAYSMIKALQYIAQTCIDQAALRGDEAKIKQWHRIITVATDAQTAISSKANTKLALADMMLNL